uniref:Uncharacterized protein n=1 Tax=Canis lupus dingo TaxID=286419 RepID=A0A8C0LC23_CANLU
MCVDVCECECVYAHALCSQHHTCLWRRYSFIKIFFLVWIGFLLVFNLFTGQKQ